MIVSIDGNIGSGKSTVLHKLAAMGYECQGEPVDTWEFIDKFYADPHAYAYPFSIEVLGSFPPKHECAPVIERCPLVARNVFTRMLVNEGLMSEDLWDVYKRYYDALGWSPDALIFIDAPPETCLQRVRTRGRTCEKTMNLEYLQKVDRAYKTLLRFDPVPVHRVDGTKPEDEVFDDVGLMHMDPMHMDPKPCAKSSKSSKSLHVHPCHHDPEHDDAVEKLKDSLWVVCMVSNPQRFKIRYALYRKFRRHVTEDLGLNLLTVEIAFGERAHQIVASDDDAVVTQGSEHGRRTIDVRVRSDSFVWQKEAAWNVGVSHLPSSCRFVLFADADVEFCNPHVATEIVHALQVHPVVQPWGTCADLDARGNIMNVHKSFALCLSEGLEWRPMLHRKNAAGGYGPIGTDPPPAPANKFHLWHPGYAIAFRREVLDALPLLDAGILGAGDHHMCACIIGKGRLSVPRGMHPNYLKAILAWESRAARAIRRDLGVVNGTILHGFHGSKAARKYVERWDVLKENQYDPEVHAYKNSHGLWELSDDAPLQLRDDLRRYFAQRNEDSH